MPRPWVEILRILFPRNPRRPQLPATPATQGRPASAALRCAQYLCCEDRNAAKTDDGNSGKLSILPRLAKRCKCDVGLGASAPGKPLPRLHLEAPSDALPGFQQCVTIFAE
ncbi:hypothetical protein predicted by Glimmer/Critica [Bordetella petrii]|uniref:Uncharacterized protein n=1 Tax=Bordetella petrii (strain ATCC BAA-461 / DSM 12804 / CCUG 43448 / CIP 107267 / Se-1111R) TaxID=340100 RepID=A9IIY3_BORPD|nr:hypothetical protein predicted by Glimmer/Critica [Bordetella petrii]